MIHGRTADGERWTTRIGDAASTSDAATTSDVAASSEDGDETPDADGSDVGDDQQASSAPGVGCAGGHPVDRIGSGELTKVVLARELSVRTDRALDAATLLRRFRAAPPAAFAYSVDGFVGATPELLVSRIGDVVRAHPMAGTLPRTGDPDADSRRAGELLDPPRTAGSTRSPSTRSTTRSCRGALLPDAEPEPSVVAAARSSTSRPWSRDASPAGAVGARAGRGPAPHPRAVGGWPRIEALAVQAELERPTAALRRTRRLGRRRGQRSVRRRHPRRADRRDPTSARLFAGVGVVDGSDPWAELEETRSKAAAVLGPSPGSDP